MLDSRALRGKEDAQHVRRRRRDRGARGAVCVAERRKRWHRTGTDAARGDRGRILRNAEVRVCAAGDRRRRAIDPDELARERVPANAGSGFFGTRGHDAVGARRERRRQKHERASTHTKTTRYWWPRSALHAVLSIHRPTAGVKRRLSCRNWPCTCALPDSVAPVTEGLVPECPGSHQSKNAAKRNVCRRAPPTARPTRLRPRSAKTRRGVR